MSRRLLVVTAFFPPAAFVGAQRPLKLVRDIRALGWDSCVLTVAASCGPADEHSVRRIPPDLTVRRVPCRSLWNHSQWWRSARPGMRRLLAKVNRGLAKLTGDFVPIDQYYPWALVATGTGLAMARQFRPDLIWATCPSLSAAYLAQRIAGRTGIPFVVDFRDVRGPAGADSPRHVHRSLAYERRIVAAASAVTYVAPDQIKVLSQKHPAIRDMTTQLVYNWFDPSEVAGRQPRLYDGSAIVHGGILYGGTRRIDGFIEALAILRRRRRNDESLPRFYQFGGMAIDDQYLRELVGQHRLENAVQLCPAVPHDEFVSACLGATVLLLVVGRDRGMQLHAGAIPGKLYNYFAARRPILVVGPPGCEAGEMVRKLRRGMAVPDDRPDLIAAALEQLLDGRGADGPLDLGLESLKSFTPQHCAGQMVEVFEGVLG